jgi:hypothetical protein
MSGWVESEFRFFGKFALKFLSEWGRNSSLIHIEVPNVFLSRISHCSTSKAKQKSISLNELKVNFICYKRISCLIRKVVQMLSLRYLEFQEKN